MPQTDPVQLMLQKLCAVNGNTGDNQEDFPFRSPPSSRNSNTIAPDDSDKTGLDLFERFEKATRRSNFDEVIDLHANMWDRGRKRAELQAHQRKEEEVKWVRVFHKQEKLLRDFNRTCDNLFRLTRDLGVGIIGCEGLLANPAGSIYKRMSPKKQGEMRERIMAENLRFPSTVYDQQFEGYLDVQVGLDFSYDDFYHQYIIRREPENTSTATHTQLDGRLDSDEPICTICHEAIAPSDDVERLSCSHEFHADCWTKWQGGFCCNCRRGTNDEARAAWAEDVLVDYVNHMENMECLLANATVDDFAEHSNANENNEMPHTQAATENRRRERRRPRPQGISDADWERLRNRRARENAARRRAAQNG